MIVDTFVATGKRRQSPRRQLGVQRGRSCALIARHGVQHAGSCWQDARVVGDRQRHRARRRPRCARQHAAERRADGREGRRVIDVGESAAEDRRRVVVVLADRDRLRRHEVRMLAFLLIDLPGFIVGIGDDEAGPVAAVEVVEALVQIGRRGRDVGRATSAAAEVAPDAGQLDETPMRDVHRVVHLHRQIELLPLRRSAAGASPTPGRCGRRAAACTSRPAAVSLTR